MLVHGAIAGARHAQSWARETGPDAYAGNFISGIDAGEVR